MSTRGEKQFIHFPSIAAKVYDKLTSTKATVKQVSEIAIHLTNEVVTGRLLEVGFGSGRLLKRIHEI